MKELFTKNFREGVKKTFYTALEGPPPENQPAQTAAESNPKDSPKSETPASNSGSTVRTPKPERG